MLTIFLFLFNFMDAMASECELSEWTVWSPCYGTCYYAQAVRNRDVIRPSLPDSLGAPTKRCAHLYETSFCTPDLCEGISEKVDLPSQSGRQRSPVKVVLDKQLKGRLENEIVQVPSRINGGDVEATNPPGAHNERRKSHGQSTQVQFRSEKSGHSFKGEIIAEGRSVAKKNRSHKQASTNSGLLKDTITIDLPKHLKPAKERKEKENDTLKFFSEDEEKISAMRSPISDVLRELESVPDFKMPMDDAHIRKVIRKNRKLMRALVEAYKLRTTTAATTSASSPFPEEDEAAKLNSSTTEEIQDLSTVPQPAMDSTSTDPTATEREETLTTDSSSSILNLEELTSQSHPSSRASQDNEESTTSSSTSFQYDNHVDGDIKFPAEAAVGSKTRSSPSTANLTDPTETLEKNFQTTATTKSDVEASNDSATTADLQESSTTPESTTATESEESTTLVTTPSTSVTTTTERMTTATAAAASYWPRKALSDDPIRRSPILRLDCMESRRCCKITRSECSDGSPPKYVKRYYRPRGSENCVPYHYPRCSQSEEMEEQPIQYEQNCQDLCFRGPEKRIAPLFTLFDN